MALNAAIQTLMSVMTPDQIVNALRAGHNNLNNPGVPHNNMGGGTTNTAVHGATTNKAIRPLNSWMAYRSEFSHCS